METELRPIRVDDIESFRSAVDAVARERGYIALLEAPPIEQVRDFVKRNVKHGYPQIVARAARWSDGATYHPLLARFPLMSATSLWGLLRIIGAVELAKA